MKKRMRISFVVVLALIMVFAMSTSAFANTTSWTSFQGNNQNNGVITGNFSTAPTWKAVQLLDATKTTGWSGVDCQPLMTTENGKTYAYVVTDSNEGAKAFKVDCNAKKVADGWQGGVPLTNIPTAQLGTGTIVNDTWYLPVSYDYQILPNAYMSIGNHPDDPPDINWSISTQNLSHYYDEQSYTGLHFQTLGPNGGIATMVSAAPMKPIDVSIEDIWADFAIQFGTEQSAAMTDMHVTMSIKADTEANWIQIGELHAAEIPLGVVKEYSVNCTRQLQQAGMTGAKNYRMKLQFSFDFHGSVADEVIVKKAEVYKNNMFVKKIENISTATAPSAVTMIDYHTYSGTIDGGRGGQLNTPMVYINGNLFFGNWIRGDANGNNYAKYFKLNVNSNQLSTFNTNCTDDGFYLAGAATFNSGKVPYLIFGSDNGNLYLFNANTLSLQSSANVGEKIRSSVCYDNGGIYFSTKSGFAYKYEVSSSKQLTRVWSRGLVLPSNATPTVSDGVVYVSVGEFGSDLGKLYALDALTGEDVDGAYTSGGPVQSSLLIYETDENEVYAYYTVNSAVGKGYCKHFDQTPSGEEIGEAGYTLQGFAAANGYLVYGNDGVADAEYKYTVSVYVAQ